MTRDAGRRAGYTSIVAVAFIVWVAAIGCSSSLSDSASGTGGGAASTTTGTTTGSTYTTGSTSGTYTTSSTGYGGGGGSNGGSSEGNPQSWQKTTDDLLFPTVSVGGDQALDLERVRVTTVIEGLRARTVVDHIFYSPFDSTLEGTFRYPLPPESSVSFFAMFDAATEADPDFFGAADPLAKLSPEDVATTPPDDVVGGVDTSLWPNPKTAKLVRSAAGTNAYELESQQQIDPGLVEEVAPNTFNVRVFPIPGKSYIRLVLAYEQTLPRIGSELEYKLGLPKGPIGEIAFTFTADKQQVASLAYAGTVPGVQLDESGKGHTFTASFDNASPGGTFVFKAKPQTSTAEVDVVSGLDAELQADYFYLRLHPDLAGLPAGGGSSRGVFLIDTSFSEHPDQFGVNTKIVKGILEGSPELKTFGIITFDTTARWLGGWMSNDAAGRKAALDALDAILLEGATDVSAALDALTSPPGSVLPGETVDVFLLSDGVVNWGDSDALALAHEFEAAAPFKVRFFAYRTGLAADNLELLSALTRKGAIFNCFSAVDIPGCSVAHRTAGVTITSVGVVPDGPTGAKVGDVLVAGRQATLYPGASITLAGRIQQAGQAVVEIQGDTQGQPLTLQVPVTLQPSGVLAPRAWAEIAVQQLSQTRDEKLEGLAMAISQRYRVASRLGSFLVLDNPQDYVEYNLKDESDKFKGQPIAQLVESSLAELGEGPSSWERLQRVLEDWKHVNHVDQVDGGKLAPKLASLAGPAGMDLPESSLEVPSVNASTVPKGYLGAMSHEPTAFAPFIEEAERRRSEGDVGPAFRALTSLVENNPNMAVVQRLAGYRVDSWGRADEAGWLFFHVLERRPFEPQSYRDLANALWLKRPALSALLFESVIAGAWNAKFGGFKKVVLEEYALMIGNLQQLIPQHPVNTYLQQRKSALQLPSPTGDLRVTITWNTNDVDIDLWVTDPHNEKCFYANPTIASGGELTDDLTQGYGPERFLAKKAIAGTYTVQVHYFANNSNLLQAETYVNVSVMTRVGTSQEKIERFNVLLAKPDDIVTVKAVKF